MKNNRVLVVICLFVVGVLIAYNYKSLFITKALLPVHNASTCVVSGCSGQVCAEEGVITTCDFSPEYACYKNAQCARQIDGRCGWTITPGLNRCLNSARSLQATSYDSLSSTTIVDSQEQDAPISDVSTSPEFIPVNNETPPSLSEKTVNKEDVSVFITSLTGHPGFNFNTAKAQKPAEFQMLLMREKSEINKSLADQITDSLSRMTDEQKEMNNVKKVVAMPIPGNFIIVTNNQCPLDLNQRISNTYAEAANNNKNIEESLQEAIPCITSVEENVVISNMLSAIPNDPLFDQQWGLHNTGQIIKKYNYESGKLMNQFIGSKDIDINAPEAWDIVRFSDASDVVVGVLDTGGPDYSYIDGSVHNNPEFIGNMWRNPGENYDGVDNDNNGYIDDVRGWNFVSNNNIPDSMNNKTIDFHGIEVSRIIGATGNDNRDTTGVNWRVKIAPLKIFTSGYTSTEIIIKALEYAINNGIAITNNSYGGAPYSEAFDKEIKKANDAGVLFIASAGNNGEDSNIKLHYPSSYNHPNVIVVGSVNMNGLLSPFSNFGNTSVHLGAPGAMIINPTTKKFGSFNSGTSFAAPYVAGAAALLKGYARNSSNNSMIAIKNAILNGVKPLSSLQGKTITGGMLDLMGSLRRINTPPIAKAGIDQSGYANNLFSVSGSGSNDSEDGDQLSYVWDFGDGSPVVSGTTASHLYVKKGNYTATVTVKDKLGLTASDSLIITVIDRPLPDNAPEGWIDSANCTISGWALDRDTPADRISTHLYFDGFAGAVSANTQVMQIKTDVMRSDVNSSIKNPIITNKHGFSESVPARYRDGKQHKVYAYGINSLSAGQNTHLQGSPKTFICRTPLTAQRPDRPPEGWIDSANCTISGWALDRDTPADRISTHLYFDGFAGAVSANTEVLQTRTDITRSDVNSAMKVTGLHGFSESVPARYRDGKQHKVYAYGINSLSAGQNTHLQGSPKTFSCSQP